LVIPGFDVLRVLVCAGLSRCQNLNLSRYDSVWVWLIVGLAWEFGSVWEPFLSLFPFLCLLVALWKPEMGNRIQQKHVHCVIENDDICGYRD
jgi:hypothetical protein